MKNINIKALYPNLVAILIFLGLTISYMSPILEGKKVIQSDMVSNLGMSKEVIDFREEYNEEAIWSNSMFGGMPSYLFSIRYEYGEVIRKVRSFLTLGLPSPAMMLFSYMLGFFILLRTLKVNTWLSIVGAIAYAFCSYSIIILEAGHLTKAFALSFCAPMLAGVILVIRKEYLLGAALLTLFGALEVFSSHVQITYYMIMLILIYVGFEYVKYVKNKDYSAIWKSFGVFVIAAILTFGSSASNLLNTIDYAKHTIRGKSELTDNQNNKTSGLDRDYVVQWSMGKAETLSLMIPGFKGRSSGMLIKEHPKALDGLDRNMKSFVGSNMRQYWGEQPFTSTFYAGAIVMFFFVLGLFIVEGALKWALFCGILLTVQLSWGKNYIFLTDFFLDYLPGYSKFRAVSMILSVTHIAIVIIAVLGIDKLIKTKDALSQNVKLAFINKDASIQNLLFLAFGLTGGLSFIFYLAPTLTSFSASSDVGVFDQISKSSGEQIAVQFMENVELARINLFKADAIRSFLFISMAFGVVFLFLKAKINELVLIALLGVLILSDLWSVDRDFLNEDNFVTKREVTNPFPETVADKFILKDTSASYRVLNLAVNTFNDASTSYRHKSVGGYHAAKLRRYQDLIDRHLSKEINVFRVASKSATTQREINRVLAESHVLNMLNTRYIIYSPNANPIVNSNGYGNAWFVDRIHYVKNANDEIDRLHTINPLFEVVIDERFKGELEGLNLTKDSGAKILMNSYKPNHLVYTSSCTEEQLAVFSEIYYEDGWNAYVDGVLTPHQRGDYVLRTMRVPKGIHKIEFKFEPPYFYIRQYITLGFGVAVLLLLAYALYKYYQQMKPVE